MTASVNSVAYHLFPLQGLDGLRVAPQPVPTPGPTQVVVRVRAASFNRRDLLLMDGAYPLPATPGVVPLSDGVGEVIAVGAGVTRVAVGARVTATYYLHWLHGPQRLAHVREQYGANHDGWLADYVVLEEDSAIEVPDHLTDAEAASLSCGGVVAWKTLADPAPVLPGETVLTVGTGTVALFAVQFARLRGARVLSVTSSAEKAKRLRDLGADETIDRGEHPDWEQVVVELTGGHGVDHVVEAVGPPTLAKSVAASAFNARVTVIGVFPSDGPAAGDPFGGRYLSIRRIAVGSRADFEEMNRALTAHRLGPVIDRVFPFEAAAEAYRYFRDGNPFGKVVLERG
ncbi:zinc-dependent alcohol dehydrogenase family protein [Nocardia sp. alder85J]|uniref:zinc-dependent alcohol dehydrogenase family protein n=1 Tax=Nocardia sp. alder85J TaxID=2862949 RepID=UPI001CD4B41C|nr:NAD(P)-dependent alcohol dehydrogenase [Nocardia sp. alder85J]MCX4092037.1 NAD(P)-dependent alcohol dehydrogenase [Nocardia sp. alder85J]